MSASSTLHWSGYTDRGKVRAENEDSFLCLQFDVNEMRYLGRVGETDTESGDCVFAVSDGMGGAMAGEYASKVVVDLVARIFPTVFRLGSQGTPTEFDDSLGKLFAQIHETLENMGRHYEECRGMGATLSLCWLTATQLHYAHIGDSRIYYLPAGTQELRRLTEDDSHVGWLFRTGQINERQARTHPRRSAISKALGAGHQSVKPQVGVVDYSPGDEFILCTDGVVEGLSDNQILRLLREPTPKEAEQLPADRVVIYAVDISGRDNTTALVVETS
jgi:PPM family protein phosphatase